jgi:hypothetical protein
MFPKWMIFVKKRWNWGTHNEMGLSFGWNEVSGIVEIYL